MDKLKEEGVLVLPEDGINIKLMPSLAINNEELEFLVEKLEKVFSEMK